MRKPKSKYSKFSKHLKYIRLRMKFYLNLTKGDVLDYIEEVRQSNYEQGEEVIYFWEGFFRMRKDYAAQDKCIAYGHDFSKGGYRGYANAETGGEDFECNRCGYSNHIIYY